MKAKAEKCHLLVANKNNVKATIEKNDQKQQELGIQFDIMLSFRKSYFQIKLFARLQDKKYTLLQYL